MTIRAGIVPYDGAEPYQRLFKGALESAGIAVEGFPQRRALPIRAVRAAQLDVLHMDWPDSFFIGRNALTAWAKGLVFRRRLAALPPVKLVWTVHNLISHDARNRGREEKYLQFLLDHCDGLMVHSDAARAHVAAAYALPDRLLVRVIPHGHFIDEYPNEVDRAGARRRLGLSRAGRVALFFGYLRPYKGLDALIRAFGSVAGPDDTLVIAGRAHPGVSVPELTGLAKQCCPTAATVRIHDRYVPTQDVQLYFNASDLVVLPFRRILNSGSLLLAMSFARCVVAPRMGSIPEVACPEGYFGYDPHDAEGLADVLREAMDRDDLPRRGRAAREFARRNYAWKDIARKARTLYETILE